MKHMMNVPFGSDDLAAMIVPPDREWSGRALGTVKSWNPDTFENVISVRDTDIPDVPLQQPLLGLTLTPGAVVMVDIWKPRSRKGSAVYAISGQWLPVGAGAAAGAVAFMRGALAKEISAEVFGERVHGATVATQQGRSSATYGDLATVGPTVPDIPVSDVGTMMVWVGCSGAASSQTDGAGQFGYMSFAVSGATSVSPDDARSFHVGFFDFDELAAVTSRAVSAVLLTGLNPGLHTLTAKYRQSGSTDEAFFSSRVLLAIGI
jgi:hypothetical protein